MTTDKLRPDIESEFWSIYDVCRDHTMTSVERLYALYKATEYIVRHNIPGDFVECGVWRGGSVMLVAHALQRFGATNRKICCFDTFEGMPPPESPDIRHSDGVHASTILSNVSKDERNLVWAISPLETVLSNLTTTGYPESQIVCVRGMVENTIPEAAPAQIALLRLDTDWYASTKHELVYLYPKLTIGGVLIIDDYGYWRGSRQAVDEYLAQTRAALLLNRIDDTGRIAVKTSF